MQPLDITAIVLLLIAAALCGVYLYNINRTFKSLRSAEGRITLTFDEEYIEYERQHAQTIRLAWNRIAVVRNLANSLCFISSDQSGIVISVSNTYKGQILDWLRENRPETEII